MTNDDTPGALAILQMLQRDSIETVYGIDMGVNSIFENASFHILPLSEDPSDIMVGFYPKDLVRFTVAAINGTYRRFYDAVTYQCAMAYIGWDDTDPYGTVGRLIDWHVEAALDPKVSSSAEALIQQGRDEVLSSLKQFGYRSPQLLDIKGATRTSLPKHLHEDFHGTVSWTTDMIGEYASVVDKNGTIHKAKPLYYFKEKKDGEGIST